MCGIVACIVDGRTDGSTDGRAAPESSKQLVNDAVARLRHRGPDGTCTRTMRNATFGHTRLHIQGSADGGRQPFAAGDCLFVANAEVYNATELVSRRSVDQASDCVVLFRMLEEACRGASDERGVDIYPVAAGLARIKGIYAFVFYNAQLDITIAARSEFGIMPLLHGRRCKELVFASERKAFLEGSGVDLKEFPPGHVMFFRGTRHLTTKRINVRALRTRVNKTLLSHSNLMRHLSTAVERRLVTVKEGELAFLLSGGLDSSVVVALARRLLPWRKIRTFSIGLEGSDVDLKWARLVAAHLETEHHEYTFTVEEGLAAVPKVVAAVETLDTTTVRASTPMWLLIRNIKRDYPKTKVIYSGEGADEVFGGYLAFHQSKTVEQHSKWSASLLDNIHRFDVRRAHQCAAAHGCEVRVPFLDFDVVNYVAKVDPVFWTCICGMEKYSLRQAVSDVNLLPETVVWRQKEQFSDGVGYEWIEALKEGSWYTRQHTDEELCQFNDGNVPPGSHEQLNIWDMFWQSLGPAAFRQAQGEKVKSWVPGFGPSQDASGRASKYHHKAW